MTSSESNDLPEAPPLNIIALGLQHRNLEDTDIQSITHPTSCWKQGFGVTVSLVCCNGPELEGAEGGPDTRQRSKCRAEVAELSWAGEVGPRMGVLQSVLGHGGHGRHVGSTYCYDEFSSLCWTPRSHPCPSYGRRSGWPGHHMSGIFATCKGGLAYYPKCE